MQLYRTARKAVTVFDIIENQIKIELSYQKGRQHTVMVCCNYLP